MQHPDVFVFVQSPSIPAARRTHTDGSDSAQASVQFSDSVTTVTSPEVPETVPEARPKSTRVPSSPLEPLKLPFSPSQVGNRSVRDRIATPYVAPGSGEATFRSSISHA